MTLPTDLKEKACLVTGASRGIGAAVARALGRCGAHVAVHYRTGRGQAALRRIGAPEECAGTFLYLCSEESSFVNGATLFVDGGWTVGKGY